MGFSDLGKKLSKLGQDTKNGVQKVSDSVSISNRISQEKKSLERLFALIGEAVYKENPDAPKAGMEDEWAAVKVAYANIAAYTEQLNNIKGLVYCPNCGRPAAAGDKFCAKCGFKLNIRPESTGEKMAKDLKEAGQEVGKIAGDAAGKTGEAVGGAAAGTKNAFSWLKGKFGKKTPEDETAAEKTETPGNPAPETPERELPESEEASAPLPEEENGEREEALEDAPFPGSGDVENLEEPVGMEESEGERTSEVQENAEEDETEMTSRKKAAQDIDLTQFI